MALNQTKKRLERERVARESKTKPVAPPVNAVPEGDNAPKPTTRGRTR